MEFINSTTKKTALVPSHESASIAPVSLLDIVCPGTCSVVLQMKTQVCQQCAHERQLLGSVSAISTDGTDTALDVTSLQCISKYYIQNKI
jgi:hypothetical protein